MSLSDLKWEILGLPSFFFSVDDCRKSFKPRLGNRCCVALQPDLAANEAQLLRKIQLLCLMEVSRPRAYMVT